MRRNKSGLPKHCAFNVDRHGKCRVRFRKAGFSAYLTGIPWGEDFMRQYAAALEGVKAQALNIGANRSAPNSLGAMIKAYLNTPIFKTRAAETQRSQRYILENFGAAHGDKPVFRVDRSGRRVMLLTRGHLQVIVNGKAATPFAQRNFLTIVRTMFQWALDEEQIPLNPAIGVSCEEVETDGYRTWSEEDIARFEACHAIGTKARLAFALLLYTGQRRGDILQLGRGNIEGDAFIIKQSKTKTPVKIPVHPKLAAIIAATPMVGVKTFLVTYSGKPYTPTGFSHGFRKLCDQAGCPGLSAHGLRKAAARRLAEIGCSANYIAAITGHASLKEVQRYTKAADRERMAREAMAKLIEGGW